MVARILKSPRDSFFLLGPRGTGKSTLLRDWFPDALWFDLLNNQEVFNLMRSPSHFADVVQAQSSKKWVVVDEVQKAPFILDEVHRLIETGGYRFALSGSSARKLKRGGANLLAGRAFVYHLFPLTLKEIGTTEGLDKLLEFGLLPKIVFEKDVSTKIERLRAYVSTYLTEEIKAEALLRNLDSFSRFLTVAALANAQVTNLSNISRDAGVSRATVTSFFNILDDTLLGTFLPAWQPRLRIKEVNHPKFYLFDTGVYRTLTDRLGDRPTPEEKGFLFETLIFNELRSAMEYHRSSGRLYYWRTHNGSEVDFIWKKNEKIVAFEIKSTNFWKPDYGKGLKIFKEEHSQQAKCFGVYLGNRKIKQRFGDVLPLMEFVDRLHTGAFFK